MEPQITYDKAAGYLAVLREMIRHENALIHQRLGWLFTLQGLLFAATSFMWKAGILPVIIFSFIGILSCISIGYTLARGLDAIKYLLIKAEDYKKSLSSDMMLPPIIGSRRKAIEWLLPSRLLPWVLGIAWIAILFFRLINLPS